MRRISLHFTVFTLLVISSGSTSFGAWGDCISWMWGGRNQETTYAPPFTPNQAAYNGGTVSTAQPYAVASPLKTDTITAVKPVVSKEWSYSRIESVQYKPVQTVDPYTGTVSTSYRAEESKSLLPWLHQKEVVRYEPVKTVVAYPSGSPVVQAYYSGPVAPAAIQQTAGYANPCDPCGGTVVLSQGIPARITNQSYETSLQTSVNASTEVAPYSGGAARTSGEVPTYGLPKPIQTSVPQNERAYAPSSLPAPTTSGPTTSGPTTSGPTTSGPTTSGPTTSGQTTSGPTTTPARTPAPNTADQVPVIDPNRSTGATRPLYKPDSAIELAGFDRAKDAVNSAAPSVRSSDIQRYVPSEEEKDQEMPVPIKIERTQVSKPLTPRRLIRTPAPSMVEETQQSENVIVPPESMSVAPRTKPLAPTQFPSITYPSFGPQTPK